MDSVALQKMPFRPGPPSPWMGWGISLLKYFAFP